MIYRNLTWRGLALAAVLVFSGPAHGETDWAAIFENGKLLHAETFDTSGETYSRETVMNVLFNGKVWMCFHVYMEGREGPSTEEEAILTIVTQGQIGSLPVEERHDFFCLESNLQE